MMSIGPVHFECAKHFVYLLRMHRFGDGVGVILLRQATIIRPPFASPNLLARAVEF
jgi:hypothetical protein